MNNAEYIRLLNDERREDWANRLINLADNLSDDNIDKVKCELKHLAEVIRPKP